MSPETKVNLGALGILAIPAAICIWLGWVINDTEASRSASLFLAGFFLLAGALGFINTWRDKRMKKRVEDRQREIDATLWRGRRLDSMELPQQAIFSLGLIGEQLSEPPWVP